ncbi:MAG: hypothetical protein ABSF17_02570 [Terracidiphilus sp.]|jgi:predicted anti-sigma-YlaC factor YlaD
MTLRCSRSTEVQNLLARGHWPLACPPDLRTHLDTCRACSELLLVTRTFQQSHASAAGQAQLPPPGVLWWRAQLRRRNAAVERVARPILGAYVFALAFVVFAGLGLAVRQFRHGFGVFDWLAQSQIASGLESLSLFNSGWSLLLVLPIFATVVLVSAVVVYLTTERL